MYRLQINKHLEFGAEPYKGKLRFVVYESSEEFVCRIETIKNMELFMQIKESRIFKGRLQLHKINSKVNVEVKGEKIGSVSFKEFKSMLQEISV